MEFTHNWEGLEIMLFRCWHRKSVSKHFNFEQMSFSGINSLYKCMMQDVLNTVSNVWTRSAAPINSYLLSNRSVCPFETKLQRSRRCKSSKLDALYSQANFKVQTYLSWHKEGTKLNGFEELTETRVLRLPAYFCSSFRVVQSLS